MKFKKAPDADALIEISHEELQELKEKGGLWLKVDSEKGTPAYFWRIQGSWFLLLVKEESG